MMMATMTQTPAQIFEIDWKYINSQTTEFTNQPLPSIDTLHQYDALLLRIHTPQDFIDAMKQVKQWRRPSKGQYFDKPIVVVYDDSLELTQIGPTAPEQSPACEAYLILRTKKWVDGTFPASIFDKTPSILTEVLTLNQPMSGHVERFSSNQHVITNAATRAR